jgi:hypothetical protein
LKTKRKKQFIATIAYYGPDDQRATKIVVSICNKNSQEIREIKKWFSDSGDLRFNDKINGEIVEFIKKFNVKQCLTVGRIIGCPHEEGIDYPENGTCPLCQFWAHRNRWTGELIS